MFGLTRKEKIANLILTVSIENLNIYKEYPLNEIRNADSEDHDKARMVARKKYLDDISGICVQKIMKEDADAGIMMRYALANPETAGLRKEAITNGITAGAVYSAALYGINHKKQSVDLDYIISLNQKQDAIIEKAYKEALLEHEVEKGDPYGMFKKKRNIDEHSLYDGTKVLIDMFMNSNLGMDGDDDKSRIVGLCAYLIAGWSASADPEKAQKVCMLYGNDFQLYNQPVEYANAQLSIVNQAYRDMRSITDNMQIATKDVDSIITAQAEKFSLIAGIERSAENIDIIKKNIYYFINQYLQ